MDNLICSIVIVNYHTEELIINCVDTLYQFHSDFLFEIIVVNNGGDLDQLSKKYNNIEIFEIGSNVGFSKANNLGTRNAKGTYVLYLNADTYFNEPTIQNCIREMMNNPVIGALGCKLKYPDGKEQLSYHDGHLFFRKSWWRNPVSIKLFKGSKKAIRSIDRIKEKHRTSHYAPWLSGAFLLMRKAEIIANDWLWDEDFFMYWEDVELCSRIRNKGYQCFYFADKTIVHIGGSGQSEFNLNRYSMMENAKIKYIKKTKGSLVAKLYVWMMKLNLRIEIFLVKRAGEDISPQLRLETDYFNQL